MNSALEGPCLILTLASCFFAHPLGSRAFPASSILLLSYLFAFNVSSCLQPFDSLLLPCVASSCLLFCVCPHFLCASLYCLQPLTAFLLPHVTFLILPPASFFFLHISCLQPFASFLLPCVYFFILLLSMYCIKPPLCLMPVSSRLLPLSPLSTQTASGPKNCLQIRFAHL